MTNVGSLIDQVTQRRIRLITRLSDLCYPSARTYLYAICDLRFQRSRRTIDLLVTYRSCGAKSTNNRVVIAVLCLSDAPSGYLVNSRLFFRLGY